MLSDLNNPNGKPGGRISATYASIQLRLLDYAATTPMSQLLRRNYYVATIKLQLCPKVQISIISVD
jgi:hypothetical protein